MLPDDPKNTASSVVIGCAFTGFFLGLDSGAIVAVKLGLLFVATGWPQMAEAIYAKYKHQRRQISEAAHDAA